MPSPAKYFGLKDDGRGHPLFWPGTVDGYPVRDANPQALKQEEYEDLVHEYDFGCRTFKLPEQMSDYTETMDKIVNGLWIRVSERWIDLPQEQAFLVLLSWIEPYGRRPPPGADR